MGIKKPWETELKSGQTAYIHDKIGGIVSNASSDKPVVSLHLYAPPIEKCKHIARLKTESAAQAACPYYRSMGN